MPRLPRSRKRPACGYPDMDQAGGCPDLLLLFCSGWFSVYINSAQLLKSFIRPTVLRRTLLFSPMLAHACRVCPSTIFELAHKCRLHNNYELNVFYGLGMAHATRVRRRRYEIKTFFYI
jgi:hypothetical protein